MKKLVNFYFCFVFLVCFLTACCKQEINDVIYSGCYSVIGDSISYGKGSIQAKSWTDILNENLHFEMYSNLSVCGAVASSRAPQTQYDLINQIVLVDPRTELITVMIGINDCILNKKIGNVNEELLMPNEDLNYSINFTQGLIYDLRELRKRVPNALIILVSPPSITFTVKTDLSDYILAEKTIADALDIPFIDLSTSMYSSNDMRLCNSDQIHPTDKGYQVIASFVFPRIKSLLDSRL